MNLAWGQFPRHTQGSDFGDAQALLEQALLEKARARLPAS
jgi:hypothetical protein